MSIIAASIRQARAARGLTQHQLAELAGLERLAVVRLERVDDDQDVTLRTLRRLVVALPGLLGLVFPESRRDSAAGAAWTPVALSHAEVDRWAATGELPARVDAPAPAPAGAPPLDPVLPPYRVGDVVGGRRVTERARGPRGASYAWQCTSCAAPGSGAAYHLRRASLRPCETCRRK